MCLDGFRRGIDLTCDATQEAALCGSPHITGGRVHTEQSLRDVAQEQLGLRVTVLAPGRLGPDALQRRCHLVALLERRIEGSRQVRARALALLCEIPNRCVHLEL